MNNAILYNYIAHMFCNRDNYALLKGISIRSLTALEEDTNIYYLKSVEIEKILRYLLGDFTKPFPQNTF